MVSNVGLNLGTNNLGGANFGINFGNGNMLQPFGAAAYENDILMPDYLKSSAITFNANNQSQAQITQNKSQQNSGSVFSDNRKPDAAAAEVPLPNIADNEPVQKSNIFKTIGATVGLSAPAIAAYASKTPVVWKNLALKVPLLGVAGYALGAIVDNFLKK